MKSGKKTGGHGALLTLSSLLPYGWGNELKQKVIMTCCG